MALTWNLHAEDPRIRLGPESTTKAIPSGNRKRLATAMRSGNTYALPVCCALSGPETDQPDQWQINQVSAHAMIPLLIAVASLFNLHLMPLPVWL